MPYNYMSPAGNPPLSLSSSALSNSAQGTKQLQPTIPLSGTMASQSRIPTAIVDADRISDAMAARLATCLLGHVLFLKSQIPLPVAQLSRMAGRTRDPRSAKRLDNLLTSVDVLSSHLGSTFTSLSSALSYNSKKYTNNEHSSHSTTTFNNSPQRRRKPARAHLVFVFGPTFTSIPAMKARIVLEIDGLEVRRLGERDDEPIQGSGKFLDRDATPSSPPTSGSENLHSSTHSKSNSLSSMSDARSRSSGSSARAPLSTLSSPSNKSETQSHKEMTSRVDQTEEDDYEDVPESDSEESLKEDEEDDDEDEGFEEDNEDLDAQQHIPDPRYDESLLLSAERLLSRTLAHANADPDKGMAAEIVPTQVHVLLRAPRRFTHPSWIPKQNLARVMDTVLSSYEELESPRPQGEGNTVKRRPFSANSGSGKVKTDGVRVSCRGATEEREQGHSEEVHLDNSTEDAEMDKMIWWCWDGKIEGLSDL